MTPILFTKSLRDLTTREMIEVARDLGLAGFDLAVRAGYQVNPENVTRALPQAVQECQAAGLVVPLVTAETSFTDPDDSSAEPLFAACQQAGVSYIKLGYWSFRGHYWDGVAEVRRCLDGFARLGERFGVTAAIHTHSGLCYGCNCAATMHLVSGFDPRHLGVYVDPGHLALDGEPYAMALDMVREYLCLVAVKAPYYEQTGTDNGAQWRTRWDILRRGLVPWGVVLRLLADMDYRGPLSFHSEWDVPRAQMIQMTKDDLGYVKGILRQLDRG